MWILSRKYLVTSSLSSLFDKYELVLLHVVVLKYSRILTTCFVRHDEKDECAFKMCSRSVS